MRVGIYVRVSTLESAKEGYSIDAQTVKMKKYCEAKDWDVYRVYTDGGYSGGNTDRPALQELLRDVDEGRIDVVLVFKLDRLSRSQKDTLELIEGEFIPRGVSFVSMTENFDTSTPFGMAMVGILSVFAQLERAQIKERMALGIEGRAKDGYWHGADCSPIGYDYTDGELVVNEYEASIVREVFRLYNQRVGTWSICRQLNERGYRTRYGPLEPSTVRKMVRRQLYTGVIEKDGQTYDGRHDAIVSEEVFDTAQRIARGKELDAAGRAKPYKANSALGGLLRCKRCGAKYSKTLGKLKKDGTKSAFYSCNSRNKKKKELVKDPCCRNKIWRMEELDGVVLNEITKLSLDPSAVDAIKNAARTHESHREADLIRDRITNLSEQISKYTELFSLNTLDMDELRERIDPLTEERRLLRLELESIEEDIGITSKHAYKVASSLGEAMENGDNDAVRFVIEELVGGIELDGETVEIHWNF